MTRLEGPTGVEVTDQPEVVDGRQVAERRRAVLGAILALLGGAAVAPRAMAQELLASGSDGNEPPAAVPKAVEKHEESPEMQYRATLRQLFKLFLAVNIARVQVGVAGASNQGVRDITDFDSQQGNVSLSSTPGNSAMLRLAGLIFQLITPLISTGDSNSEKPSVLPTSDKKTYQLHIPVEFNAVPRFILDLAQALLMVYHMVQADPVKEILSKEDRQIVQEWVRNLVDYLNHVGALSKKDGKNGNARLVADIRHLMNDWEKEQREKEKAPKARK